MGFHESGMAVRTRMAGTVLFLAIIMASACDVAPGEGNGHAPRGQDDADVPSTVVVWGCEQRILSKVETLDPRWRQESSLVGDFGFNVTEGDFQAFRPHERADLQFKLPVTIEGHSGATVWIPHHERDRVALILADVPRRGPGNSYRIEDGHQAVRFEPCVDKSWSAWTAGLALADRREIVLNVKVDGARRPTPVTLGPWTAAT
jgi:hypothetical protein